FRAPFAEISRMRSAPTIDGKDPCPLQGGSMRIEDMNRSQTRNWRTASKRAREAGALLRARNALAALALLSVGALSSLAFAADRQSGIQNSFTGVDGDVVVGSNYVIVSKDVGGDRWAITLNKDDGSVVGNIFPQAGGTPQFVTCQDVSDETTPEDQYAFAC